MSDKPSTPPTLADLKRAEKLGRAINKKRGRTTERVVPAPVHPQPAEDTLFTLRLSRRLARQEAADELAKTLPKRGKQGVVQPAAQRGPRGPYKTRGSNPQGEASRMAVRLAEDRAAGLRDADTRPRNAVTPRSREQDQANEWVADGVRKLAMTCPPRNHIVLMAATCGETGKVGAASSIQLSAMDSMTALGHLVAEVNESFVRDDVGIRVELRMHDIDTTFERVDPPTRAAMAEDES